MAEPARTPVVPKNSLSPTRSPQSPPTRKGHYHSPRQWGNTVELSGGSDAIGVPAYDKKTAEILPKTWYDPSLALSRLEVEIDPHERFYLPRHLIPPSTEPEESEEQAQEQEQEQGPLDPAESDPKETVGQLDTNFAQWMSMDWEEDVASWRAQGQSGRSSIFDPFCDLMCWKDSARSEGSGTTLEEFRRGLHGKGLFQSGIVPAEDEDERGVAFSKWNHVEAREGQQMIPHHDGEGEENGEEHLHLHHAGETLTPMQLLVLHRRENDIEVKEKDWTEAAEELALIRKGLRQEMDIKQIDRIRGEARTFEREKKATHNHLLMTIGSKHRHSVAMAHHHRIAALPRWERAQMAQQAVECLPNARTFAKLPNPAKDMDIAANAANKTMHMTVVRGRTVKGKGEEAANIKMSSEEAQRELRCNYVHKQNMVLNAGLFEVYR